MPRLFPAVSAITPLGKLLVFVLRLLYRFYALINGRRYVYPKQNFEENPLYYGKRDVLYFGYKYYVSPHEVADKGSGLEEYFRTQDLDFSPPATFITESSLTLSVGGDLMPYAMLTKESTRHLWDECGDFFFGSDIVFANLETPMNLKRKPGMVPEVMLNNMHFNGSEALWEIFSGNGKYRGYDVVSTANNHSFDMGEEGVKATIEFLEKKNVTLTGTSLSPEGRLDIPVLEKNGIRIAFIAATYCLNHLELPKGKEYLANHGRLNLCGCDLAMIYDLVEAARRKSPDLVVLSLHTGNAYQAYPGKHTVDIFHRIFESCGPDIILGSHPHNPQPMEKYPFPCPWTGKRKEGFAAYSPGDFVAHDIFTWCHLHLMLKLHISKSAEETRLTGIEVLPHHLLTLFTEGRPDFRFVHLPALAEKDFHYPGLSGLRMKEAMENHRFWETHLAPQMRDLVARMTNAE